ncbi:MAG: hypothetical protein U1E76_13210 [Planctomycetota bacterium]
MNFTSATILFLCELVVGSLAALAWLRRAQIGRGFTRFVAGTAAVCVTIAGTLAMGTSHDAELAAGHEHRLLLIALCLAVMLYLFCAGRSGWVEAGALWFALAVAIGVVARLACSTLGPDQPRALAVVSMLCAGLVLGFVSQAMVLGHWYLVAPGLALDHLGRLNRASLAALYARAALLGTSLVLFADRWLHRDLSTFRHAYDLFILAARALVGLAIPIVLGHLTSVTVRLRATQPATGILYASTVLVLMGELLALMLTDSLGIPA